MKKKLLLTSILTIVMCFSLIVGSTFALFTSESTVNVAVTSGKVSVVANIDETSIQTKQLYDTAYTQGADSLFEGDVTFSTNTLTLTKFVPGDGVKFNIIVKNESTVGVKYRTSILCMEDTGLFEGLNITIGDKQGSSIKSFVSGWEMLDVDAQDAIVPVTIELPESAGNKYQDKTCTISYSVEAIQGNASKTIMYDASTMGGLYEYLPTLKNGDVLVLPTATYTTSGTFTIPAGVTIRGAEGANVVFHQNSSAQDNIFNCEGDVIIENITFESNRKGYAIADNTKNHDTAGDITVINCKFIGIATEKNWGIYKNLNGDLTVINCTFDNYNNVLCGINNGNGSITTITGCTFTNINGEAIGYVASTMPINFEADVILNNTGLTADNVIGY